jgi:hypothetical protein
MVEHIQVWGITRLFVSSPGHSTDESSAVSIYLAYLVHCLRNDTDDKSVVLWESVGRSHETEGWGKQRMTESC